jgi:hypothetical protein
MPRRLGLLAAALVAVFLTSGCLVLKNVTPSQVSTIGDVQITGTICVSGGTTCPESGNTTVNAGNNQQVVQLLVAYRVPVGTTAPAELRFAGDTGTGPLFTRDASYASELTRLAAPPAGEQWVGYGSTVFTYTPGTTPQSGTLSARFTPPRTAGVPYAGPFNFRMVAGTRAIDATHPITTDVACGDSVSGFNSNGSDGQTVCIDSPAPDVFPTDNAISTRDLAVAPGAPSAAPPGGIAAVPFSLKYTGTASVSAIFGLTATTTLPGATPSVSPATLTPTADSSTPVLVSIPVPAGTAPGHYLVTLTAAIGTETRAATASVTIGGAGGGGATAGFPGLSGLSVSPRSIGRRRGSAPARIRVTLSQAGTLRVAVARAAKGRRSRGRCVAPTRRLIRAGAARCIRFVGVTTIAKRNQQPGPHTVAFSGRGRAAGTYRLTLTIRTAAGLVSAPKVAIIVVRR